MLDSKVKEKVLESNITFDQAIEVVSSNNDVKVLKRVPECRIFCTPSSENKLFHAAIIDLETLGLDPDRDSIIEIGFLRFSFTSEDGIVEVKESYNGLQDPGVDIPEEISKITGITNEDVSGKSIDWDLIAQMLNATDLVICHNSSFDRNFLELKTPEEISSIVKRMAFGCSMRDVDWRSRGYESTKLEFLNFKAGYFYEGHRALIDCWATLNVLAVELGAFDEMKVNVRKKEILICAVNSSFETKDLLKSRGYRWSDGTGSLPKSWWTTVAEEKLDEELAWMDESVYKTAGAAAKLPRKTITARLRYSRRAELFE